MPKKSEATPASAETDESLEDAFSGGGTDGGGVFGSWGQSGGAASPAPTVPSPASAPAASAAPVAAPPVAPAAPHQSGQSVVADSRAPYRKPVGFRVSVNVAKRLEKFRKDKNLTVTEVVMLMADKSVGVMEEMLKHSVQGPKVQTSLFAPQGVAGPPKGTGSEQRQWSPRPEDREVMAQLVEMSGLPNESTYIAVALNYCLPEKPCKKD